jgi:putative ABC transport system substrate-binding protein
MRRREFIAALGGAAAWPVVAPAQRGEMPVIGFLNVYASDDKSLIRFLAQFRRGLREAGFVEGQNLKIEFRWGEGQHDRLLAMAADLVRRNVAVIAAGGPPAAVAAKAATTVIPIVFTSGGDAVKLGLVTSLSRPGGNATGVNMLFNATEAKRLGLLHNLAPKADLIAVLLGPTDPVFEEELTQVRAAARSIGQRVLILNASNESEIDAAFATLSQQRAGALLVGLDTSFLFRGQQIIALAARYEIPTLYSTAEFTISGGFASYGVNIGEAYRIAGSYVGRILKGEKPSDLPVQQTTKFEFVINLKTAKALGLAVPPTVLALADEVIE